MYDGPCTFKLVGKNCIHSIICIENSCHFKKPNINATLQKRTYKISWYITESFVFVLWHSTASYFITSNINIYHCIIIYIMYTLHGPFKGWALARGTIATGDASEESCGRHEGPLQGCELWLQWEGLAGEAFRTTQRVPHINI